MPRSHSRQPAVLTLGEALAMVEAAPAQWQCAIATALFTGLRLGETEMWAVPGDPRWIYLRGEETVERWPLDREVPGCA